MFETDFTVVSRSCKYNKMDLSLASYYSICKWKYCALNGIRSQPFVTSVVLQSVHTHTHKWQKDVECFEKSQLPNQITAWLNVTNVIQIHALT